MQKNKYTTFLALSKIILINNIEYFIIYLCEYFLGKITTNKLAILSDLEKVSVLSAHGEKSSKLFTGSIRFPSC